MKTGVITCCLLLQLISCYCCAQPGSPDGGGIVINTLLDKNGGVISSNDPFLIVRKFIISDGEGASIKEYSKEEETTYYGRHAAPAPGGLFIPPFIAKDFYQTTLPAQLVQFVFRGDTCSFEFRDIQMAIGVSDHIDTLQLLPGHHRIYMDVLKFYGLIVNKSSTEDFAKAQSIHNLLSVKGVTTATKDTLEKSGLLAHMWQDPAPVIYRKQPAKNDTLYFTRKPVYRLWLKSFSITAKTIALQVIDFPMIENDTLLYRLCMLDPPPDLRQIAVSDKDPSKLATVITALRERICHVNGQPYSGYIKMFSSFNAFGPGIGQYGGYNLCIFLFKAGKLVKEQIVPDVDLDDERQLVRPV